MSRFPDTTRKKPRRWMPPWYAALAAPLVVVIAAFSVLPDDDEPVTKEEVYAGVEDIAVGTQDVPFPPSDASRFEAGTAVVRVYVRVEEASLSERMTATVERSGNASAFSALFGGSGVRAEAAGEGRLAVSEEGASGVASFVVRAADGATLPEGGYRVEVRFGSGGYRGAGPVVARKYFAIGEPQD